MVDGFTTQVLANIREVGVDEVIEDLEKSPVKKLKELGANILAYIKDHDKGWSIKPEERKKFKGHVTALYEICRGKIDTAEMRIQYNWAGGRDEVTAQITILSEKLMERTNAATVVEALENLNIDAVDLSERVRRFRKAETAYKWLTEFKDATGKTLWIGNGSAFRDDFIHLNCNWRQL